MIDNYFDVAIEKFCQLEDRADFNEFKTKVADELQLFFTLVGMSVYAERNYPTDQLIVALKNTQMDLMLHMSVNGIFGSTEEKAMFQAHVQSGAPKPCCGGGEVK